MSTALQTFVVHGIPAPKGSWRAMRNPRTGKNVMVADNAKKQNAWKTNVILAANAAGIEMTEKAVSLNVEFQLPRKRNHSKYPICKPDIDKLIRAVMDCLTGIAYLDDSRVCQVTANKSFLTYKPFGLTCATTITIMEME